MKFRIYILALFFSFFAQAQHEKGLSYGLNGALQINSAILPDLSLNTNINSLLGSDSVVKGEPQLADFTLNYKLGAFGKYDDGFGFTQLSLDYTTTSIQKEVSFNTGGILNPITLVTLDRKYAYFDASLSYNVYIYKGFYFGLGATTSSLLSSTGDPKPESSDFRAFTTLGLKLDNGISIDVKGVIGISEVYKGSYIHHIMIPITVSIPLNK
jgi:hypothetical protein